jgi:hypothetical protein
MASVVRTHPCLESGGGKMDLCLPLFEVPADRQENGVRVAVIYLTRLIIPMM